MGSELARRTVPAATAAGMPTLVADAGDRFRRAWDEFFGASIDNDNTRHAYERAAKAFFAWLQLLRSGETDVLLDSGSHLPAPAGLREIGPLHVASYLRMLKAEGRSVATRKQHLAALRMFFGHLTERQLIPMNVAAAVKGPVLRRDRNVTPLLDRRDVVRLFDHLGADGSLLGLRDRAFIGVMAFSFARVSAVCGLDRRDLFSERYTLNLRFHEKNDRELVVPANSELQIYLDAYLDAAGSMVPASPLFRSSIGKTGELGAARLDRTAALRMVKRRCAAAGVASEGICNHTFRGSGITTFLENGGELSEAQNLAGHRDIRTTRGYDGRDRAVKQKHVEMIDYRRRPVT